MAPRCGRNAGKWWCGFALVLLVVAGTLIGVSLKKVKSTELGLKYNVHSKKLADAAKTGGLHTGPPGFRFIKFPSTFITADLPEASCVSKEGIKVQYSVTFQYQMPEEWIVPAVVKYRDFEKWAKVVEAAGVSSVHQSCSEFLISNFQNKRGIIQETMEENLRLKLEGPEGSAGGDGGGGVYARAVSLQLRNVDLPEEYQEAVAEKLSAQEDIALARNERTQETTKAETELLKAKEEARKIMNKAANDANVTLTEATLKAEEMMHAFETEAGVIARVKEAMNLTTEGVLAYMANRLLAQAPKLKVTAGEPA
eukprot:CAMPEP_0183290716 /NCGR_PEP_ID=MMETSP0160_2-20130417/340_1 /TAXON_ID=2839 ORGANISM="Odontella Sinensis, Strain Grunow 1884" /NCGR_SAMPLE_ID=MMETSP0160_2 /ASSEMBLY_ACC=CAM_ASM_000250 /LENGTH=310 /DNA_ID=CAMNT_0025451369 /DNA_START=65 /DNA_END=994 /DNA_ORIENTATION=+